MARIQGVRNRRAGLRTRLVYGFTRRALVGLAGRDPGGGGAEGGGAGGRRAAGGTPEARDPERLIEPVRMYAHLPGLLQGYARLEQATAKLHHLDPRHAALAELKAATMTGCAYCVDLGSQIARRWGISDQELLALPHYRTSDLFCDLDRLVLDYAVAMSSTPVSVTDELFDRLRGHFDEPQLVELTHLVALENMRGRFNLALGIDAAGFSEGRVCAVPSSAPAPPNGSNPPDASGPSSTAGPSAASAPSAASGASAAAGPPGRSGAAGPPGPSGPRAAADPSTPPSPSS